MFSYVIMMYDYTNIMPSDSWQRHWMILRCSFEGKEEKHKKTLFLMNLVFGESITGIDCY